MGDRISMKLYTEVLGDSLAATVRNSLWDYYRAIFNFSTENDSQTMHNFITKELINQPMKYSVVEWYWRRLQSK